MRLQLRFLGLLQRYTGIERTTVELKEGATLKELLAELDRLWGESFPPEVWDRHEQKFKISVSILADLQDLYEAEAPLQEGQEVIFVMALSGGKRSSESSSDAARKG